MDFNLQPTLRGNNVLLQPLLDTDFDHLYQVACDPEIWAMHPNKDRYKKEVFQNFFEGALKSGGALKIMDVHNHQVIGCSRFYDHNPDEKSIYIGYSFFAKRCWGQHYNTEAKHLMLNYIFQFVDKVFFHVGAENFRSQKAMEKLGALKIAEEEIAYYGEATKRNFKYLIEKSNYKKTY